MSLTLSFALEPIATCPKNVPVVFWRQMPDGSAWVCICGMQLPDGLLHFADGTKTDDHSNAYWSSMQPIEYAKGIPQ